MHCVTTCRQWPASGLPSPARACAGLQRPATVGAGGHWLQWPAGAGRATHLSSTCSLLKAASICLVPAQKHGLIITRRMSRVRAGHGRALQQRSASSVLDRSKLLAVTAGPQALRGQNQWVQRALRGSSKLATLCRQLAGSSMCATRLQNALPCSCSRHSCFVHESARPALAAAPRSWLGGHYVQGRSTPGVQGPARASHDGARILVPLHAGLVEGGGRGLALGHKGRLLGAARQGHGVHLQHLQRAASQVPQHVGRLPSGG